ncbi:MAG: PKD domain-containing protein, partial [Promethearchaeota archaeon]
MTIRHTKKQKWLNKTKYLALFLLTILLIAELAKHVRADESSDISFTADKYKADVGEFITFSWEVSRQYSSAFIRFGDGNTTTLDPEKQSVIHKYDAEGTYNVTLLVRNQTWSDTRHLRVVIKNYAPQFVANVVNNAFEDEIIIIGIDDLVESPVDINNLTYIYDFGDGCQNTTKSQTFKHSWKTAGTYPVTITAIDDQGAIHQETEYISIINEKPEAKFTFGAEIPATYSFSQDFSGKIPFGWSTNTYFAKRAYKVIDGKDSRGKVLEVVSYDPIYSTENHLDKYEGEQWYGTIEYQFMSTNVNDAIGYMALISDEKEELAVFAQNGKWKYRKGGLGSTEISDLLIDSSPENNKWRHIRIDFCIEASKIQDGDTYFDLTSKQFRVIIDGKLSAIYSCDTNGKAIFYIRIGTLMFSIGKSYIDSIGVSWDENYNVGDNYNVFQSSYYGTYDWRDNIIASNPKDWSTHEQDHDDIVIVDMDGDYKEVVQIDDQYNNDRLWMENSLELHHEEFSYEGDYPATYSFKGYNGQLSPHPNWPGWIHTPWVQGKTYTSITNYGDHSDVIIAHDWTMDEDIDTYVAQNFGYRSQGTIEFWFALWEDPRFYEGGAIIEIRPGIMIYVHHNYYFYISKEYDIFFYVPYSHGSLDHHRISFDTTTDTFNWYINGEHVGVNLRFFNPQNIVYLLVFESIIGDRFHQFFVDAVGYSWDPNYNLGDNCFVPPKSYDLIRSDPNNNYVIRSPNNINLDLQPQDKIEVTFRTNQQNQINLNLKNNGEKVDSFILSEQGNSNYETRTVILTIDDYITIDQLEFSGNLPISKKLELKELRIYRSLVQDIKNGTVEYYIKTSDINKKTWEFKLFNDLDVALSITIKDGFWIYTIGDGVEHNILGCGYPTSGWHHVRVDFSLDDSNYMGLSRYQFKVIIDDIEAQSIYTSNINVNSINKIRFESGIQDTGIAWIDAIGYSWDPLYEVGDNKISVVVYPEKTRVLFSAADSLDTESDLDSLRFYWDFGDGLSSFGKYVFHDYLTSGRYNVTLYCKDDNGAIDTFSQLILVFNVPPEIYFTNENDTLVVNEGQSIVVNCVSYDDVIDLPLLSYWWNFETLEFSPYYLSGYVEGSQIQSHIYTDDFEGKVNCMVKDPEELYDYDSLDVLVKNIDPAISIYDANVIANISLEILRSSTEKFTNFTFDLLADDVSQRFEYLTFYSTNESVLYMDKELATMTLSKNWKIIVNSTDTLPENSWFRYLVKLELLNGDELIIDSGKFYGGNDGYWGVDLNRFWFDDKNYSFNYPLTLNYSISDPSIDDVDLTIAYNTHMTLEINCSNALPIIQSFTIEHPINPVTYEVEIREIDGLIVANISVTQLISSKSYEDNDFPVSINSAFTIYPLVDLHKIFEDNIGLTDFEILNCRKADNIISANVEDDDGGKDSLSILFTTNNCIKFGNLSPYINAMIPSNSSMLEEIVIYAQVSDFDQFQPYNDFGSIEFKSDDVPTIPEDFEFINGTIDSEGDLCFPDNNYMTIQSEGYSYLNTVFEDNFYDGIRHVNWTDDRNFGKIIESDSALKLKANWLSYWGDLWCWTIAWAPYCKIPTSLYSEKNWEVSVKTSEPCYMTKRHHYGLMLYQDDENVWLFGPLSRNYIKLDKIVNGKLTHVACINSTDKYLKISNFENKYYFEHSPDNYTWKTLKMVSALGINPTDVGVFHKAWLTCPRWVYFHNFTMKEWDIRHELNFTSTLKIGDNFDKSMSLNDLKLVTRYKTNSSQLVNVSLYNFDTKSWTLIDSSLMNASFYERTYAIPGPEYYDSKNEVLVKFEALSLKSSFKLYLDQLRLEYSWTIPPIDMPCKPVEYGGENVPSLEENDITLIDGIVDDVGDLILQDNNYISLNSTNTQISLITRFKLENTIYGDIIESLDLLYSYKTDINQLVALSIYNFTSDEWIVIDSTIYKEFINESYSIPISRIEEIQISEEEAIVEHHDFYNSTQNLLVKIEAVNLTEDFQFYLDMLKIQYTFTPHHLLGNDISYYDGLNSEVLELEYVPKYSDKFIYTYKGILIFNCIGKYLVAMAANDDSFTTTTYNIIEIINPNPFARIGIFPNETIEDTVIQFIAKMESFENSTENIRFLWSFGDGTYSIEQNPSHAWSNADIYNISLLIIDPYGNMYVDIKTITVKEEAPKVLGPFTFSGVEGQAVVLDLEIYDSLLDELTLRYSWYGSNDKLISTDKKPIVILNSGSYTYKLVVTDDSNLSTEVNVSVIIEDIAPMAFISNYRYSGTPDNTMEIVAYGFDTFYDIDELKYYWTISNTTIENELGDYIGIDCKLDFTCDKTIIYKGEVKVVDPSGKIGVSSFIINSFIDSNGNGLSDEFEEILKQTGEPIDDYTDSDNDGYTDLFELGMNVTDRFNPDSDGDGLLDGFNYTTGVGELTLGTQPYSNDTDHDNLSDSFEFYGWKITTEYYGEIHVTSSATRVDTDWDGLKDYEEFSKETDPRNPDTDNDGLLDGEDPFPTKYDGDGDGLSDKIEVDIGTLVNGTDTDEDGLSDGEEVIGWGFQTNPLSDDSDHDFLPDKRETQSYVSKMENRRKLDGPISLLFEEHCEKAASAQIAFSICFGESSENYGVQDVPNLNIQITKEQLILLNMTTNGSRYISHIVDIREVIESNQLDYYGRYTLKINNTLKDCTLEQYEISVAKYLDPNDEDYDDDGIMDGVESS